MVASRNGASPVLRIGALVPERRPVEINGTAYLGYVRGRGCPRSVLLAYQAAFDRWLEADADERRRREPDIRAQGGTEEEIAAALQAVGSREGRVAFYTAAILAVLPQLEGASAEDGSLLADCLTEADVLNILAYLSWTSPTAASAAVEPDAESDPKASATGAGSSAERRGSRRSAASAERTSAA